MSNFEIKSISGRVLYSGPQVDLKEALQEAVKAGTNLGSANLRFANLRSANLRSANLGFANLRSADLRSADLGFANLRSADLRSADLGSANLGSADLRSADLRSADLRSADLSDITVNWSSHTLLAEILFRAAGDDVKKRMVAGLIAVSTDWCWNEFLDLKSKERAWALGELAKWVKEGDNAPEVLVKLAHSGRTGVE